MTEEAYRLPVMEVVKTAWAKVSGAKSAIWAVIGLFVFIQIIVGVCGSLGGKDSFIAFIFNILSGLIQVIAAACLIYLGIRRAAEEPIHYKMIKDVLDSRIILYVIGLYFLQMLIFIPCMLIAGMGVFVTHMHVGSPFIMLFSAVVLFLVATFLFLFLSIRMWLAYGIVIDKKLNSWKAIQLSFKATEGNVWNLVGLYFIDFLIAVVCTITFGIGFIWGFPWLFIIYGEVYKRLSTQQAMRSVSSL